MNSVAINGQTYRSDNLTGSARPLTPEVRRAIAEKQMQKRRSRQPSRRAALESLHAANPCCTRCRKETRLAPQNARVDAGCATLNADGALTCGYCQHAPASPIAITPGMLDEIVRERMREKRNADPVLRESRRLRALEAVAH